MYSEKSNEYKCWGLFYDFFKQERKKMEREGEESELLWFHRKENFFRKMLDRADSNSGNERCRSRDCLQGYITDFFKCKYHWMDISFDHIGLFLKTWVYCFDEPDLTFGEKYREQVRIGIEVAEGKVYNKNND